MYITHRMIVWMLFVLMLCGCNTNTKVYTGPKIEVANVTIAEIYVALDTRGEFKVTGGLPVINFASQLLGIDDVDASFEYTIVDAKKQSYMLYILWQDENNHVVRNEYRFDGPFEVTFDRDDWVSRIAKAGDNVVIFVVPNSNGNIEQASSEADKKIARISSDVEEVNLRHSPGYVDKNDNTDVIIKVPSSAIVEILDGPQTKDDLQWWYINWNGYEGWVAETTGSGRSILIFSP